MNAETKQIWSETLETGVKITYLCDRYPNEARVLIPGQEKPKVYEYHGNGITITDIERLKKFLDY